jgi:hypothetical protein
VILDVSKDVGPSYSGLKQARCLLNRWRFRHHDPPKRRGQDKAPLSGRPECFASSARQASSRFGLSCSKKLQQLAWCHSAPGNIHVAACLSKHQAVLRQAAVGLSVCPLSQLSIDCSCDSSGDAESSTPQMKKRQAVPASTYPVHSLLAIYSCEPE